MDRNQSVWQKPRIEDSKFSTSCLHFLIPECSISQTSVTFLPVVNYQGETSVFPSERDTSCSSSPSTGGQELGIRSFGKGTPLFCCAHPTCPHQAGVTDPTWQQGTGSWRNQFQKKRDILKIAVMGNVEANGFKYYTLCKQKKKIRIGMGFGCVGFLGVFWFCFWVGFFGGGDCCCFVWGFFLI